MPDFAVSTAFKGKDSGINAAWKRMTKNARLFGNTSANAFDKASRSGRKFQSVTSSILKAGLVQRGISMIFQGVRKVTSDFIDMDKAVTGATVRFKDIGPKAANFAEKMKEIEKAVRSAASKTEFTGKQAGEAMDFLARAGFSSADGMKSLIPMINLATASGEDFAQVADQSSDLLGAFGLASKDSAQKLKNLVRLNDVLVKSANSANVTIETQFETMKIAAPIFAIFGDQLEEVAALTSIMGNAGIKGSQGATALKNAILRLAAPTPKVAKGMAKLGLKFEDVATVAKDGKVNMKTMTEILATMSPLLKKLGTKDQAEVLDSIFGKRAIAATANLIKLTDDVKDFKTGLKAAGGTTKETADIMRKTLFGRIKRLGSVASKAGDTILDAFRGDAKSGITALAGSIDTLNVQPIITGIKIIITLFKGLFTVISFLEIPLKIMAALFLANVIQMKAMAALAIAQKVFMFAKAFMSAGKAVGFMNLMLSLNPIGAIVIAIAAAIAGIIRLISIWDKLVATFNKDGFFAAVAQFFGLKSGSVKVNAPGVKAPNSAESSSRQQISVNGKIGVQGPPGTTVESKTSGPAKIPLELLGA